MKSVNRKVLLTLFGIVLAAPFLVIATVVGAHAATLANMRADFTLVALGLLSVAASVVSGHRAVSDRNERAVRGCVESKDNTDLRGSSSMSLGY